MTARVGGPEGPFLRSLRRGGDGGDHGADDDPDPKYEASLSTPSRVEEPADPRSGPANLWSPRTRGPVRRVVNQWVHPRFSSTTPLWPSSGLSRVPGPTRLANRREAPDRAAAPDPLALPAMHRRGAGGYSTSLRWPVTTVGATLLRLRPNRRLRHVRDGKAALTAYAEPGRRASTTTASPSTPPRRPMRSPPPGENAQPRPVGRRGRRPDHKTAFLLPHGRPEGHDGSDRPDPAVPTGSRSLL